MKNHYRQEQHRSTDINETRDLSFHFAPGFVTVSLFRSHIQ